MATARKPSRTQLNFDAQYLSMGCFLWVPWCALLFILSNQQMKGVLTGFRETGTDKVPDISADKCRADFDLWQRSVDALLKIPDHHTELEEMLEQWAMIGAVSCMIRESCMDMSTSKRQSLLA
jgi:hypothetical protein